MAEDIHSSETVSEVSSEQPSIDKFFAVVIPATGTPEVLEADSEQDLAEKLVGGPWRGIAEDATYPIVLAFHGTSVSIKRYKVPVIEIDKVVLQYDNS